MASWRNWRGPAGWILVAAALAQMVRAVLAVLNAVSGGHLPVAAELASPDADPLQLALVALVAATGIACRVPPNTSAGRTASRFAAALIVVAGLGDLTRLVVLLGVRPPTVPLASVLAGLVARLLVEAAAVVALAGAARVRVAPPAAASGAGPEQPPPGSADADDPLFAPPLRSPAVWHPDPTAGTVWRRAGDAATGAAGISPAAPGDGPRGAPDWRPARAFEDPDDAADGPSEGPS